jgi:hypothetical protein
MGPVTLVAVNVGYRAAKWGDEGRLRVRTSGSGCAAERKRGPNLADQAAANERHGFQQPNFREERAYMVQEIADLVDAIDFLE